ncbi:MAG: alpha/beta fold hydrolase [Anaerolineae bacterium]
MSQTKANSPDSVIQQFAARFRDPLHQAFHWEGTNGKAAIFVHGFPGTPAEMRGLAGRFHAAGWTASAPLLPGFGADLETLHRRTVRDWTDCITALCADARRDHDQVVLVGFSLGGALSIRTASQVAGDGLIAISPFLKVDHVLWKLLPLLKFVIPNFKPFGLVKLDFNSAETREGITAFMPGVNLDDPAVQQAIRDFAIPTRMLDQLRAAGAAAGRAAPSIQVPTLVIQGKDDRLVTPANTRSIVRQIPNVDYRETPGEHNLLDEHEPSAGIVGEWSLAFANTSVRK